MIFLCRNTGACATPKLPRHARTGNSTDLRYAHTHTHIIVGVHNNAIRVHVLKQWPGFSRTGGRAVGRAEVVPSADAVAYMHHMST